MAVDRCYWSEVQDPEVWVSVNTIPVTDYKPVRIESEQVKPQPYWADDWRNKRGKGIKRT